MGEETKTVMSESDKQHQHELRMAFIGAAQRFTELSMGKSPPNTSRTQSAVASSSGAATSGEECARRAINMAKAIVKASAKV